MYIHTHAFVNKPEYLLSDCEVTMSVFVAMEPTVQFKEVSVKQMDRKGQVK